MGRNLALKAALHSSSDSFGSLLTEILQGILVQPGRSCVCVVFISPYWTGAQKVAVMPITGIVCCLHMRPEVRCQIRLGSEAGLSQVEFSERCGFYQTYLSRVENGKANPTLNAMEVVANALGLTF